MRKRQRQFADFDSMSAGALSGEIRKRSLD